MIIMVKTLVEVHSFHDDYNNNGNINKKCMNLMVMIIMKILVEIHWFHNNNDNENIIIDVLLSE